MFQPFIKRPPVPVRTCHDLPGGNVSTATKAPRVPGQRRGQPLSGWLPSQAGPVEPGVPGDPLLLGEAMRERLRSAVVALLADPTVRELKDAAKLAAVVLYAKARAPCGRKDDLHTSIWGAELGRWLGMSESTVHHAVLPALREADAAQTRVEVDEWGQPTGLDCVVMPAWRTYCRGDAQHPLALSQKELATLLRLCEALFGPGWAPKNRKATPPGLLAGRKGRGAATDRLGLLLMVLSTNAKGWLRLCPGWVDSERGRPAATLARLLRCTAAAARKVLTRLQKAGVVLVDRATTALGMNGSSRVRLIPVARARGLTVQGATRAVDGAISDRPATAVGDLETRGEADTAGQSDAGGVPEALSPETSDRPATAELHTSHSPVACVGGKGLGCMGFSGGTPLEDPPRPERAGAREDAPENAEPPAARQAPPDGSADPLRGDHPATPAAPNTPTDHPQDANDPQAPGGGPGVGERTMTGQVPDVPTPGHCGQRGRVPRPPVELETVVASVAALWERLSRGGARRRVVRAVRLELGWAARLVGRARAGEVLAARLRRRLTEQGGPHRVTDPVGWLLGKGLPRRADCGYAYCDDGLRMDTGGPCPGCEELVADRRSVRHGIAADIRAELPYAEAADVRAETERRLHQHTRREAERLQAAKTEAEWARARAAEADRVRQAVPCADCGAAQASGLCGPCGTRRRARAHLHEAALLAAACDPGAGTGGRAALAEVLARVEAADRSLVTAALDQARESGATEEILAAVEAWEAGVLRDRRHAEALAYFAPHTDPGAETTGEHVESTLHAALARVRRLVAETAPESGAEPRTGEAPAPKLSWAQRCRVLAARPLSGEVSGPWRPEGGM